MQFFEIKILYISERSREANGIFNLYSKKNPIEKTASLKDQISLFTQMGTSQQVGQLYNQFGSNMTSEQMQAVQMQQSAIQQRAALVSQATNSIFESINKVQLAKLKAEENRLESQKDSIENKLKMQQQELKSVEEAEKEGIKDATPTFGLA